MRVNVYQKITDELVKAMSGDLLPWRKSWEGSFLPRNGHSQRLYQGINVPYLWSVAVRKKFKTNEWYTYKGALQAGGNVMRGQKAVAYAVYWKLVEKNVNRVRAHEEKNVFPLIRTYPLWNRDQVEGMEHVEPFDIEPETKMALDHVGQLGYEVREGSPGYLPDTDMLEMPPIDAFDSEEEYLGTLFHELAHWTGHSSRLNRRLGNDDRAYEELVAELASCYACGWFNISRGEGSSAYLKSWTESMGEDNRYIFKAGKDAMNAARYLLGSPPELAAFEIGNPSPKDTPWTDKE